MSQLSQPNAFRSGCSRRFRDVRDEVRFSPDSGKIVALQRTTLKIQIRPSVAHNLPGLAHEAES